MAVVATNDNVTFFISKTGNFTLEDKVGKLASIGDISDGTVDEVEITSMEDAYKKFAAGASDPGSFDFTTYLEPEEYANMLEIKKSGEDIYWASHMIEPSTKAELGVKGMGHISDIKITGLNVGSALQRVVTIRRSGEMTADFEKPTE